jgi:cytochrome P450
MDPPEHSAHRSMVNPSFTASALAPLESKIRQSVTDLLDAFTPGAEVEFVAEIAAITPIKTICAMMGAPPEDEPKVFRWTNGIFGTDDPDFAKGMEESNRNYREIFDYGFWLISERRREPRDDLLTLVANARIDGAPLEERVLKSFFSNMMAAGNETTRSSLSGAIAALARNPDQRSRLVAEPTLIEGGVNELLRYVSPVIQMMRTAKEDVEVGGKTIAAGERVVMLYGAGNHDPAFFDDPHRLDVTRKNAARNLSFGNGIHHCVGSRLATMQLRVILEEFLKRFPAYTVRDEPAYVASNFVQSMKSLPVRLTR